MTATLTCAQCGGDLAVGDRYCGQCGAESPSCVGCGRPMLPSDFSCPQCGTPAGTGPLLDTSALDDGPSPWTDLVERLRRATLGEFEIAGELGRGGMAAVFLAHDLALDREVAIKVMAPGLFLGEGMADRFRHEAITVARLHHPHIVPVHAVRQAEGLYFFVMRYVRGRSLDQVLRAAGRLPLPAVRSILWQVGSALSYAHRSGVVHRDVKPANILIADTGDAIVTDFGIAKAAERPSQTLTGALVGTPAYMSPEQCRGGDVGWLADQYALGAVAYELVTGAPPFGGSTFTMMQAHIESAPESVRERCQDCPPELEAAILRMLEKDPAARFPRMADALAALAAEPLSEDDPARLALSAWAGAGEDGPGLPTTPTSPVPRTRTSLVAEPSRAMGGISIMPAPASLEVGDSFTLAAVIRGQHGTRLPPRAVEWTVDDPAVLRVDSTAAMATAVAPGTAMVTAACKGITARLRVEVAPARADEIVIGPADGPLHVGDEIRLDALPRDKRGWPVARPVAWHSDDPAIAEALPHGAITGRAPGTVRITCTLDDARASIVIPVLPPRVAVLDLGPAPAPARVGRGFALTATPLDRRNLPLAHRAILWSTSDTAVAMVTADGYVEPMRPGTAVLTATCEGVSASVRVTIAPRQAPAIPAPPPDAPAPRRRTRRSRRRRLLAGGVGAAAVLLSGLLIWPGALNIGETGAIGPEPAGESTDTGEPVAAPAAAALVITGRPARSLRPEAMAQLAAEVRDAGGHPLGGAPVSWLSRDTAVAQVDRATGRVHARRPGRAIVVAIGGGRSDSVPIVVRRVGGGGGPATIVILPRAPLRVGDSATLTAVALGAAGDTLPAPAVQWRSSDSSVAAVEPGTGEVQALSPGSARIIAEGGGGSGELELTVLTAGAAALQILGARPMAVRETLALRVLARDAWGTPVPGDGVRWSTTDSSVATVDERSGMVVGREPGRTQIVATLGGIAERLHLAVLPRPQPIRDTSQPEALADPALAAGVAACYGALRVRDVDRLSEMYRPVTQADHDMLKRLRSALAAGSSVLIGERHDREPRLRGDVAVLDFSVRITRVGTGAPRSGEPVFRAEFARGADGWRLSSCRIVGTPAF